MADAAIEGYTDTVTVAARFGLSIHHLGTTLSRHPELRPARRVGNAYLWTDEEIERFGDFRMRPISRGRRKEK